jgi:hypothetical protein
MLELLRREEDDFLERFGALDHVLPLVADAAHADEVFHGADFQENLLEELGDSEDGVGGYLSLSISCLSDTRGAALDVLGSVLGGVLGSVLGGVLGSVLEFCVS